VNQLPANPVQICGNAYQKKKSCNSVGVARNSQLYVHETDRIARRLLSAPSATTNPSTTAAASETTVSSSAVSAPLQYGPEESACQNRGVSKLASTSTRRYYLTSATGILYRSERPFSVPFTLSRAIPSLIWVPNVEASALR
jgi:hypothetical protein